MKFLIDENVRKEVVDFLIAEGFNVYLAPTGSRDEEIAKIAKEERRIILTHDIHFSNILLYPPERFAGIIRLKIHPPRPDDIIAALKHLLTKLPPALFAKKLIILEKDKLRIR